MTNPKAPRLYLLAGPSCSGKSTYRGNLATKLSDAIVLSSDDIIQEIANADGISYHDAYLDNKHTAKAIIETTLAEATGAGLDVIWDQTNLTAEIRRTILAMIPDEYERIAIAFEAPLSLLLDRAWEREQQTGKHVPSAVITSQHGGYERPHFDEGFDHVFVHDARSGTLQDARFGQPVAA